MDLYSFLLHIHSGLRYVVLVLLIVAIANSIQGVIKKYNFNKADLRIALFGLSAFHLQYIIGVVLYFFSPKVHFHAEMFHVQILRFFTIEHVSLMTLAFVLITIGYSKAKKHADFMAHKRILLYYFISFLCILIAIPWPFRSMLGSSWF